MPNFLEQLVAEWYEYQGYFVRRNVNVAKRANGGYDCELDIVAFNPKNRHLVHVETSMDARSWAAREEKFATKFAAGRKYIHGIFQGLGELPEPESIAVIVIGSGKTHQIVGGGRLMHISELMRLIKTDVGRRKVDNAAIPEQYVILRTLQFAANFW
jgi:hypothetical protein